MSRRKRVSEAVTEAVEAVEAQQRSLAIIECAVDRFVSAVERLEELERRDRPI